MIKNSIYFIVFCVVFACQSIDKPIQPKTLIEEDQMVDILTDIAIIKAAKTAHKRFLEEKKINPEAYILQKHGIDSLIFEENNIWYAAQLETYESIFKRVKANLEKSKDKYEKLKKEEDSIKKIKDSIRRINDTLKNKKVTRLDKSIKKEMEKAKLKRLKTPEKKE